MGAQKEGLIEEENDNILLDGEDEDDWGEDDWVVDEWDEDDWVVDEWDENGIDLEEEELEVTYECSFDMNELEFCLTTELVTQEGEVLAAEKDYTDAIITEYGGLDARVEINGETYLLSDYEDNEALDNCFLSICPLLDILKVYMKARKEAYDRKVKSNLSYNRKLERDGNGVKKVNMSRINLMLKRLAGRPGIIGLALLRLQGLDAKLQRLIMQ